MKKLRFSLAWLALLVVGPLACSSTEEGPANPLAHPEGFCDAWAKNACVSNVVAACQAQSTSACVAAQTEFCLSVVPADYDSKNANRCLAAVKKAYADADITAEELHVVRDLAAPCDGLSKGSVALGGRCRANSDCDTTAGVTCVKKLDDAEGSCEVPEEATPGGACDGDNQVCSGDFFCNGENCVAYKATGDDCLGDYQCAKEDGCFEAACTKRTPLSEECLADRDCQSGYCADGLCADLIRLGQKEPLCDALR